MTRRSGPHGGVEQFGHPTEAALSGRYGRQAGECVGSASGEKEQPKHRGGQHDADRSFGHRGHAHGGIGQGEIAPRRLDQQIGLAARNGARGGLIVRGDVRGDPDKQADGQRGEEDQRRVGSCRAGDDVEADVRGQDQSGPKTDAGENNRQPMRCVSSTLPTLSRADQKRAPNSPMPNKL